MSASPSEISNSNRMSKLVNHLNCSDMGYENSQDDYSSGNSNLEDECVSPMSPNLAAARQQQFNEKFQLNYNLPSDIINSSFKDHINSFSSSGLGDSISLPCDMYNSYINNSTVNQSISSTPSTPPTNFGSNESSSQKINPNAPIFTSMANKMNQQQKQSNISVPAELMSKLTLNSNKSLDSQNQSNNSNMAYNKNANYFNVQMGGLGQNMGLLNQIEYDPFNDYMGMDRNMLQMSSNVNNNNEINKRQSMSLNIDQQQHQQLLAQIAANNFNNGNSNREAQSNKPFNQARSVTENIEMLNSKFINQKSEIQANCNLNEQMNNSQNSGSINSLLATVAAAVNANPDYNSPNLPTSIKRQSGAFNSINQSSIFTPQIANTSSPNQQSNRLNMFASIASSDQNR